ncbi:MAG: type II secretion system F family protein [Armatimonadetes bacterium]|nr:type II secretion system F family protein [Armatimonadota bacterium]
MLDSFVVMSMLTGSAGLLLLYLGSPLRYSQRGGVRRRGRGIPLAERLRRAQPPPREVGAPATRPQGTPAPREERRELLPRLTQLLSSTRVQPLLARIEKALTAAKIPLKATEFVYLSVAGVFAALMIARLVSKSISFITVVAAVATVAPFVIVRRSQLARFDRLEAQIADALLLMTNCLRSGTSFMDAMEAVAKEMDPPISEEFQRALRDVAVGVPVDEAFIKLRTRCQSEDLDLAVTAFKIQREVGGALAEILGNIAETIRERHKLKREVQTLTAQGKLSGGILCGLPPALAIGMQLLNPGYFSLLLTTPEGRAMMLVGIGLQLAGVVIISQLVKIEV